jgi:hypothetical protein
MGFLDSLFGKKDAPWTPSHRAILKDLTYDEIVSVLGRPTKAAGGFVYWRGELDSLDEDYPEGVFYQLSNKDFRGLGDAAKKPRIDRENWFLLTSDPSAVQMVANELDGMPRNIEVI